MAKPQLNEFEEKGRFGADFVKRIIENGWRGIVQEFQGLNDRGIDFIVQDVHRGRVTSLQFNIQVKTSDFNAKFPGDSFPAPVDKNHIELWRDSNVPVVLVCVDAGSPPVAFWRLIRPGEDVPRIRMSRRNVFNPASRDSVVAEIRRALPQRLPAACGEILKYPLQRSIRDFAKDHYRELMKKPYTNSSFGPIEFTWKGWRHMTRQGRSMWKIRSSLLLLPSVLAILDGGIHPTKWRSLKTITRGKRDQFRTILVFERIVKFDHRVPAWVQVVIEAQAVIPTDWAMSAPYDPRRKLQYKFLNLSELSRPVRSTDLSDF
jgi:hypothetical protein